MGALADIQVLALMKKWLVDEPDDPFTTNEWEEAFARDLAETPPIFESETIEYTQVTEE